MAEEKGWLQDVQDAKVAKESLKGLRTHWHFSD
jgi:hypothetical protein